MEDSAAVNMEREIREMIENGFDDFLKQIMKVLKEATIAVKEATVEKANDRRVSPTDIARWGLSRDITEKIMKRVEAYKKQFEDAAQERVDEAVNNLREKIEAAL